MITALGSVGHHAIRDLLKRLILPQSEILGCFMPLDKNMKSLLV